MLKWLKEYWGLLFIIAVLVTMATVAFHLDPGGIPGGSFEDDR